MTSCIVVMLAHAAIETRSWVRRNEDDYVREKRKYVTGIICRT